MTADLGPELATNASVDLLGVEPAAVETLSQAPTAAVYRLRLPDRYSVIAKLFAAGARWTAGDELNAIQRVRRISGIPTSTALRCAEVTDRDATALFTTDLGVRSLHRAVAGGERTRAQALHQVGELLGRLHGSAAKPEDPASAPLTVSQQIAALQRASPERLGEQLAPALHHIDAVCRSAVPTVWCHGDLHLHNVMLPERGPLAAVPHLLDFEAMTWASAEYDLAQSLVTCDAYGLPDRGHLLAGYRSPVHTDVLEALIVLQTLRGWVWAALIEQRHQRLWAARMQAAARLAQPPITESLITDWPGSLS